MSSILDVGEVAALGAALSWTASTLAFAVSSRRAGSFAVNQFRLLAALPAMALLAWAATGEAWPLLLSSQRLLLLLASGVVGFVVGDAFLFAAYVGLGPRLTSALFATWPAMTTGLVLWWDREVPPWPVVVGVAVTLSGIVLVLLRGGDASWNPDASRRQHWQGVGAAFLGALGQAVGVALARPAMQAAADLPGGVPPAQATLLRLAAAVPAICLLAALRRKPFAARAVLRDRVAMRVAVLGTLTGPVFGVLLMMVAVRYAAHTGVAAALMATTPLFLMLVAAVRYRERVGWRGVLGTALTVAGAGVLVAAG